MAISFSDYLQFYHSDDFLTIVDEHIKKQAKQKKLKRDFYKPICRNAAELLNESGLREKFEVDPDFVVNFAERNLQGDGGVFLRSESGYEVVYSFLESTGDTYNIQLELRNKNTGKQ